MSWVNCIPFRPDRVRFQIQAILEQPISSTHALHDTPKVRTPNLGNGNVYSKLSNLETGTHTPITTQKCPL
jgi:hypothetical protein